MVTKVMTARAIAMKGAHFGKNWTKISQRRPTENAAKAVHTKEFLKPSKSIGALTSALALNLSERA